MSYDPSIIANAFIKLSEDGLSNVQLQKLMYLAHGTYLVTAGKPLLDNGFQAWDYGPVSVDFYQMAKSYGRDKINEELSLCFFENLDGPTQAEVLAKDEKALEAIKNVYDTFKDFTPAQLIQYTHQIGSPWQKSYQPGVKDIKLNDEDIKQYFADEILIIN